MIRILLFLLLLTSQGIAATVTTTVGTASRDYSTVTLWEADLDDTGVYSSGDDAVGEMYDDSDFNEAVTIDGGGTVGLNSQTITVASGQRHDGTANSGVRQLYTTSHSLTPNRDNTFVRWQEIDHNGNGASTSVSFGTGTAGSAMDKSILHNYVRASTGRAVRLQGPGTGETTFLTNSIIYDLEVSGGSANLEGVNHTGSGSRSTHAYNVTIHDLDLTDGTPTGYVRGVYFANDVAGHRATNVIVTDTDGNGTSGTDEDFHTGLSNVVMNYNMSSDTSASGTGSLTSKTSSNQYVSTTGGSEDLHLKAGADALDAGLDLGIPVSGMLTDIDGNARGSVEIRGRTYRDLSGNDNNGTGVDADLDSANIAEEVLSYP